MSKQPEETLEYEDFLGWTTTSLKDYLAIRGLKQGGNKPELVARAFAAYEYKIPLKFNQEEIYKALKDEYSRRLRVNKIDTDPNNIKESDWLNNVREWPEIDEGKTFSYILRVKAVDVAYIGVYKDQKAYSYWKSGFVDTVYVSRCPTNEKHYFLKSHVCPSQRLRNDAYRVTIFVEGKKDPKILSSWCTCTAGAGEVCNHVIAVLYKVNYAHQNGYISPACTSMPQGWNIGTKKEVEPCKISDLTPRKDKKTKKESARDAAEEYECKKQYDPRKPGDRKITSERVSLLLNNIKLNLPSACVLLSVEHGTEKGTLPKSICDQATEFMADKDIEATSVEEIVPIFLEHCQMTATQVAEVEKISRGQSANLNWKQQRLGRVTASKFHTVSTKSESLMNARGQKKVTYTPLVGEILYGSTDISSLPQIQWGVRHEKTAIKTFMAEVLPKHDGGLESFRECGLFVKPDHSYLAGSPDGIVTCKCCGVGTVEVKCPYSVRNSNIHIKEVYSKTDFIEEFNGHPRLKRTHKYYTQVQAQMWAVGASHSFFIVWTEGHKPLYEVIQYDSNLCLKAVNNITLFYKAYVLPCLLGYRNVYECPKCCKYILEESEINNPDKENSVCCDSCNLWWHLTCAESPVITSEDDWICNNCLLDIVSPNTVPDYDEDD